MDRKGPPAEWLDEEVSAEDTKRACVVTRVDIADLIVLVDPKNPPGARG